LEQEKKENDASCQIDERIVGRIGAPDSKDEKERGGGSRISKSDGREYTARGLDR